MGKTIRRPKSNLEIYQSIRRDWGDVNPVTKIKESEKLYRRSRNKRLVEDYIDEREEYAHEEYYEDGAENLEF